MVSKKEHQEAIAERDAELSIAERQIRDLGEKLEGLQRTIRDRDYALQAYADEARARRRKADAESAAVRRKEQAERLERLSKGEIRLADEDADIALVYDKDRNGVVTVEITVRLPERDGRVFAGYATKKPESEAERLTERVLHLSNPGPIGWPHFDLGAFRW